MKCSKFGLVLLTIIFLSGCITGKYIPPKKIEKPEFSIVINKDFNTTWKAIINYISKSFFEINNYEKQSGLVTLSFGATNPSKFVTCGHFKVNSARIKYNGGYVNFLEKYGRAKLIGSMNITARKISDNSTEVRINARYVLTDTNGGESWVFESGSSSTIAVQNNPKGTNSLRTCRPTYNAEHSILSGIKSLAQ